MGTAIVIWDHRIAFWLLLFVAVGLVLAVSSKRRRRAAMEKFAESRLLDLMLPDGGRVDSRAARLGLRIVALTALVAVLAGPRWGFRWEEVRRQGVDLIVAVDTSRSMLATDVAPNRLERAKLAVLDVLPRLRGDRVALVPFAGAAFLECPLTLDYAAFSRSLRGLNVETIPVGGTDLAGAIDVSLGAFASGESRFQALILITDGEDHAGQATAAASRAAEKGINIYTVGIGTADGELIPLETDGGAGFLKDRQGQVIKSRLDEEALAAIAEATGGAYVRGIGPALGLDRVFDEHIAAMERREISSSLERRHEQRFQVPLTLALVLLFLELGVSRGRGRERRGKISTTIVVATVLATPVQTFAGDPMEAARQGFAAHEAGRYADAVNAYREALLDEPDAPMFRFNLADALYESERYQEAAVEFARVAADESQSWHALAAYNLGNSLFRVGEPLEDSDPGGAIERYNEALAAYRQAMSADPADSDPKHGYEFVSKRLQELEQRQQEEKQQEQQEQPDEQDQQGDDQQPSDAQRDTARGDEAQQDENRDQESEPSEGDESEMPPEQAGSAAENAEPTDDRSDSSAPAAGEPTDEERRSAQAILNAAKAEELESEDVDRGIEIRGGPPVKDW